MLEDLSEGNKGQEHFNYVHGKSHTKVHSAWCSIKERCFNPNNQDYKNYGGSGIGVSEVFLEDFMSFYSELGDPPSPRHSVDRIDYTKNYEPGNIRWATPAQQSRNRGKKSNNTSGVTGVGFDWSGKSSQSTFVYAQWHSLDLKLKVKKFNVDRLGLLVAFRNAVVHRNRMIEELNLQGAGYSENHGK